MAKGTRGANSGKKTSHYAFKRRCEHLNCKKRAKVIIEGKYYCKEHSR